jgi:hypothetical protein
MKIRKSLAGVAAGSLALTGLAVIAAPSAQAASYNNVYSGINSTSLQAPQLKGVKNVSVTVSPASPSVGQALTVSVTSPDIAFDNGPAAIVQANWSRIDAIVSIGGTDYLIKGPRNVGCADVNTNIIQAGWTISSANGADSGTGANGTYDGAGPSCTAGTPAAAAATDGVATLTSAGAIATASASITAPAAAGSYPVVLKALVNNSVSSVAPATGGTGQDRVSDGFDELWGIGSTVAPYSGTNTAAQFGTVQTLTVIGPEASITAVTNSGADGLVDGVDDTAVPTAISGGIAYARNNDGITIAGNNAWDPAYTAPGNIKLRVCANAAATAGCSPYFVNVQGPATSAGAGTLAVNGSGQLATATVQLLAGSFTGANYLIVGQHSVTAGYSDANRVKFAAFPLSILGATRTLAVPSAISPNVQFSVSGSNWYPGETVSIAPNTSAVGDVNGSPTAAYGAAFGSISSNLTLGLATTATSLTATGIGGSVTTSISISKFQCIRQEGTTGPLQPCVTEQNVSATVLAGNLSQVAAVYTGTSDAGMGTYTNTSIPFGSFSTALTSQTRTGGINPITVTDLRGGLQTWSLTASLPAAERNLVGSGNATGAKIEGVNLALGQTVCTAAPNSATGVQASTGVQTFDAASLTVCNGSGLASNSAGDTTGGQWVASAPISLTVPAFQKAGDYATVITFTLT